VLIITVTFGAVGLWDDFLQSHQAQSKGVPGGVKLASLCVVAAACA